MSGKEMHLYESAIEAKFAILLTSWLYSIDLSIDEEDDINKGSVQGRHFSFFRGGHNFDRLPEGGAKYEKYKIL